MSTTLPNGTTIFPSKSLAIEFLKETERSHYELFAIYIEGRFRPLNLKSPTIPTIDLPQDANHQTQRSRRQMLPPGKKKKKEQNF